MLYFYRDNLRMFNFMLKVVSYIFQLTLTILKNLRSLFVFLSFFFWSLCCLFFFDIRILIAPFVSSNSSYIEIYKVEFNWWKTVKSTRNPKQKFNWYIFAAILYELQSSKTNNNIKNHRISQKTEMGKTNNTAQRTVNLNC